MQIIYKHCISLVVFLSLTIYFFNPVIFENKELKQHDIEQWKNGANEIIDYRKNTNKEALWTNSMFSGMPAYLIDVKWKKCDLCDYLCKEIYVLIVHKQNKLDIENMYHEIVNYIPSIKDKKNNML